MHDGGEAVVAGLAAVDMVVGVHSFPTDLSSHNLNGSVGDDFVSVHVGLSA